jgi:uncharacterized repeat protein (TIGR01451 family)
MKRLTRWLILVCLTSAVLAITAALIAAASSPAAPAPVETQRQPLALLEPELAKALASAAPDARLNVIVELREPALPVAPATFIARQGTDLPAARRLLVNTMQSTAAHSQAGVRAYLAAHRLAGSVTHVRPFWIFNGLAVGGARPDVVRDLATHPDIALIRLDHQRQWIPAEPDTRYSPFAIRYSSVEWGVERIRADQVWHTLGVSGTGVVVANMDSGVDWRHPALQPSYRGYDPKGFHQHAGNWYDATGGGALYPVDGNGHGSHTMGTLAGQDGIGVAPGARWIAVRAFNSTGLAYDSWLHAGFEWLLAPEGDPDLAPHLVSNSWGNNVGASTIFQDDLDALRAAGIFPIFSAGNSGPDRGTVGSPASLPGAFAVGATDQDDEVANFSSRGPSPWGQVRPHVAAPGVNVNSALPGGSYAPKNGTSMAAPHVAGTVALMMSAQPNLTITQTAYILTRTAVPLSGSVPNNDTGYGRVDAYAAVALAANAGVVSGSVSAGGVPLSGAAIQATPAISGLAGATTTGDDGRYRLFIGAGNYDLTASAFGYAPAHAHALPVVAGATTVQNFDLTPLPTGHVRGTVTASGGGAIEATVSALGTPVADTASGGNYDLALPAGDYVLEARALGYRVLTASVTVSAGQNLNYDFVLPATMRVLLVDSGPWYYQSQAFYYRQALDDLAYAYDQRSLKHLPADLPTLTELLTYDLLIWSSPNDSPGMVGAGQVISNYLGHGGNLLLSGQDVAFWDGGGNQGFQDYYLSFLHSVLKSDNAPSRQVVCLDDSAFDGVSLTIQGAGGADNQLWPDQVDVYHPDHAALACNYQAGQGAVIQAGFCNPHRALNLGFGFEAINDATDRADFMSRALDWFTSPRQSAGVELLRQTDATQVAPAGHILTHTLRLRNLGEAGVGDTVHVAVSGADWPTTLLTPNTSGSIGLAEVLDPCATTPITVRVEIPSHLTWNAFDAVTLTARSSVSPALSQSLVLTSKVPAPLLLVDDDRWYDQEQVYEQALQTAGLPFDRWQVKGIFGAGSPPAEVLAWYPQVLWFNGYDWFDPIHPSELGRLTDYLDQGGRLFLSSQEYLYVVGPTVLTRDYFGVISHSETLSQTVIQGVPGDVLGDGLGPVVLDYPFKNWSDSVLPAPGAQVAFRGQHGQPGALTHEGLCSIPSPGCRWRTAFFAFPFEALPGEIRPVVMSRLVGWLSWLGRSDLQADRAVAAPGEEIGYTLTLRNDGLGSVAGVVVSNTLPPGTTLIAGPDGGASYDAPNRRVTWSGDLAPGAAVTFSYRLRPMGSTALGAIRNAADFDLGDQGIRFQRQADVRFAAPDLSASSLTMSPATANASTAVAVTLVLHNSGPADAPDASVDHPLPWPLRLVTGTLSSSGVGLATEVSGKNRLRWEGALAAGAPVTLTYRAVAPPVLAEATWLYNAARLEDGQGGVWERGGWLYVQPHRLYLPVFAKNGSLSR